MQHQEIVRAETGQWFIYDPPDGRPDAAPCGPVVDVCDGDTIVDATEGSCAIDPVTTALHGDAPAGSRSICVTTPRGIAPGGRFLMTKPNREREWIHVIAIEDGRVFLEHPLIHRYAGAATIIGCRISIAVSPAWAARASNLSDAPRFRAGLSRYVLRWTYSHDGHVMSGVTYADLVTRRSTELVTGADIDRRSPGWTSRLPPEHRDNQGADFIAEAVRVIASRRSVTRTHSASSAMPTSCASSSKRAPTSSASTTA